MTEKVVFAQSMEALYRALSPHTPLERAAFAKAQVISGDRFAAAYPVQLHVDILDACAQSRFSQLEEFERYAAIGRLYLLGFEKTLLGSALMAMLKVLGPRRALDRMTRNFRTANNFTEGTVQTFAPNHHWVHINYTVRPGFYFGLLESGCLRAGAKDLVVKVVETKNLATTYEIKWA